MAVVWTTEDTRLHRFVALEFVPEERAVRDAEGVDRHLREARAAFALKHPHVHVLLTDGGWLQDGSFRHLLALDAAAVEKLFRAEVLRLLVARGKISEEVVANLLSWRHSGLPVGSRSGATSLREWRRGPRSWLPATGRRPPHRQQKQPA